MTASQTAKERGFKSLTEVAKMFGCTRQTLCTYFNDEPIKFKIVLNGCILMQREKSIKNAYGFVFGTTLDELLAKHQLARNDNFLIKRTGKIVLGFNEYFKKTNRTRDEICWEYFQNIENKTK